jgi:hypothetical protein
MPPLRLRRVRQETAAMTWLWVITWPTLLVALGACIRYSEDDRDDS